MVAQFVKALERPVSRVRLENDRTPSVTDDLDMVTNYLFNLELSEAFYPSLQAFEISLRNAIHATLSNHSNTPFWFDDKHLFKQQPPPASENRQIRAIREARRQLSKEKKAHTADRIIAELHLGFWHSLFNREFERSLWMPNAARLLREVFPNAPKRPFDRQIAWNRCDKIRILRNRVMHYEPIWNRAQLARDHQDTLDALRWITDDMHETIAMCDRFDDVLRNGKNSVEQRILPECYRRYPQPPAP